MVKKMAEDIFSKHAKRQQADKGSDAVFEALAELPGPCQAIVRMREFERLSNQEIAKRMGISLKRVDAYVTHITNHLSCRLTDS